VHATKTELSLLGKFLNTTTVKNALITLEKKVEPNNIPPNASPVYRKGLAGALFYKVWSNASIFLANYNQLGRKY